MDTTDPLTELRILREAARLLAVTQRFSAADRSLIAAQVRAILHHGTRTAPAEAQPWDVTDEDAPPFPGFTIAQRVRQLGYQFLPEQSALIPYLEQRIQMEWVVRFSGMPAQYRGQDWYSTEDMPWVDGAIENALRWHVLTRTQPGEEPTP